MESLELLSPNALVNQQGHWLLICTPAAPGVNAAPGAGDKGVRQWGPRGGEASLNQ